MSLSSIEEGLRDKLVTAGIGTFEATTGWAIHIGILPAAPDTAISIAQYGGEAPLPSWLLDFPRFQIRVRGGQGNYKGAKQKAQDIKDLLLGISHQTVGGNDWGSLLLLNDIMFMGNDEKGCPNFVLNIRMIVEPGVPAVTNRQAIS